MLSESITFLHMQEGGNKQNYVTDNINSFFINSSWQSFK